MSEEETFVRDNPRLCIACKHHSGGRLGGPHYCDIPVFSLVTGEQYTYIDCDWMRKEEGQCGRKGRFFKAKGD